MLAFSIDFFESGVTDVTDIVDEALLAVINVTEDGLESTLSVLLNVPVSTFGADVIDQTGITLLDVTENWLRDTFSGIHDKPIGTGGTHVVLHGTLDTVQDIALGHDDLSAGLAVGNHLESGSALLTDSIGRAEVTVQHQTFGTFVPGQVQLVLSVATLLTSVLEETVVTIVHIALEAISGGHVREVHQSWALSVFSTISVDIAGVTELSWASEA